MLLIENLVLGHVSFEMSQVSCDIHRPDQHCIIAKATPPCGGQEHAVTSGKRQENAEKLLLIEI